MDGTSLLILVGVVAAIGLALWILRGSPRGGGSDGSRPPYRDGSIGDGGIHDHGGGGR